MRVPYALAILILLGIFAVLVLPPEQVPVPVEAVFKVPGYRGVFDSLAPVGSELWVTDKGAGAIVIFDRKSKKLKRILRGRRYGFEVPNGIAALVTQQEKGQLQGRIFIADMGRAEVLAFTPQGELVEAYGKGAFIQPRGIAGYRKNGTYHLLVTDQRSADVGALWHLVVDGNAGELRQLGTVRGEVESVAVVPQRDLVLVANETLRRLEYIKLSTGKTLGVLGQGVFRGEPEGIAVWEQGGPRIIALDQLVKGRIIVFGPRPGTVSLFTTSEPELVSPDGLCITDTSLYVVSEDSRVLQIPLAALY